MQQSRITMRAPTLHKGHFMSQFPGAEIKALSWKPPYGSLMLHGKYETRTWNTNVRGWVLICNSAKAYGIADLFNISGSYQMNRIYNRLKDQDINLGFAIALGYLSDVRPMTRKDEDRAFVRYSPDLFIHQYDKVYKIDPFKWKGRLGFTDVSEIDKQKIFIL